jgi:hypothetical protein
MESMVAMNMMDLMTACGGDDAGSKVRVLAPFRT